MLRQPTLQRPEYRLAAGQVSAETVTSAPRPEQGALVGRNVRDGSLSERALHEVAQGAQVTVAHSNAADRRLAEKLASRGIVPGALITVLKAGSPLLLRVDNTRWAISIEDAAKVMVLEQATPDTPRRRGFRLWR